ncbi:hypothetical protein GIB67_005074 [Kingdonia uniflora]|uniref:Uncharacterized protein n=1 Tax=Kingdonia uniflora TaxID=39325 RepID=A0A7J7KUR7_9MAGN|nr:hypothetical protein GIB67_005074 [Kingdonia uniflora]
MVKSRPGGLVLVLINKDVPVEGFCMSTLPGAGQCVWPFHQLIYGPQSAPLVVPNGEMGLDGMAANIASLLPGTVANPFGNGYFQGLKDAPT